MSDLHKILIVGASMGLAHQLAALLPDRQPPRPITEADTEALSAAEVKRQRRAERNRKQERNQ